MKVSLPTEQGVEPDHLEGPFHPKVIVGFCEGAPLRADGKSSLVTSPSFL